MIMPENSRSLNRRGCSCGWGLQGDWPTVRLIPTMGALLKAMSAWWRARSHCGDAPVASIFVNPTQFGRTSFAAYPRDGRAISPAGGGGLPSSSRRTGRDVSAPMLTTVKVTGVANGLCDPFRPGHFDGVATVVASS
jgi:pantoate--beta-alanine ligase